jgi:surface polysaccharide O-acyltransferase-like enzyme
MSEVISSRPDEPQVELIRALAIFMVVALHVSAPLAVAFNTLRLDQWMTANVVESFVRPCVPLFVMVSGMLLLAPQREYTIRTFLVRRFGRVGVPFLSWACLYFVWRAWYHGEEISMTGALGELVSGPVYTHFWFVYMLMGLYLATPILGVFTRYASHSQLWYFVVLWFIASSLVPALARLWGVEVGIGWSVALGFSGYYLLGYVLRGYILRGRRLILAVVGVVLLAVMKALGTWYGTRANAGELVEAFYDNLSPNVILMSGLMFLIMRSLPANGLRPGRGFGRLLQSIGTTSFGVYLVHPIVQETLMGGMLGFELHGSSVHPLAAIPVTTAVVVLLSALVVVLLRSTSVGRTLLT